MKYPARNVEFRRQTENSAIETNKMFRKHTEYSGDKRKIPRTVEEKQMYTLYP